MKKRVFVVSDATGDTAERIVRATLLHFDASAVEVRTFMRIDTDEQMEQVCTQAAEQDALIVYTLVASEPQKRFAAHAERYGLRAHDLIGDLLADVSEYLGQEPAPASDPHAFNEEMYQRIEAIKFMVEHDDGAVPEGLPKADLVLVGISRTTKTPLSMFLAQRGVRCANVPLVLGIPPPAELEQCDPNRVIALTVSPEQLLRFRRARMQQLGMDETTSYATHEHIEDELAYARSIYCANPGWPVVDVTGRGIEENGAEILAIHNGRWGRES